MIPIENKTNIHWFPGHMAKAMRLIQEQLKQVDAVLEVCDARAPLSTRNNELTDLLGEKKRIVAYNKSSLADDTITAKWTKYLMKTPDPFVFCDAMTHQGIKSLLTLLSQKRLVTKRYQRTARIMVLGFPNVGKSMLINTLTRSSGAKTENRPGVTRGNQWIRLSNELHMMDTPGILVPKIHRHEDAFVLAALGSIKETVFDKYALCLEILTFLKQRYPALLQTRYKLSDLTLSEEMLLSDIARNRGLLIKGGETDIDRASNMVFDEFKNGKIGKITLQLPPIKP